MISNSIKTQQVSKLQISFFASVSENRRRKIKYWFFHPNVLFHRRKKKKRKIANFETFYVYWVAYAFLENLEKQIIYTLAI